MSSQRNLSGIPIVIEAVTGKNALHWRRRLFQVGTLFLAVFIPLSGLFRIDPVAGAFVILDRQIWWSDFLLVFGFWLMLASSLVLLYSAVGTAFCGWSCPQNTFSEWANWLTQKFLGKRAKVELDGLPMAIGSRKNHWANWAALLSILVFMSMFLALIPLLYFYPPDVIVSFLLFEEDERLASSIHYIYFIFVVLIFLDLAFIRHFWCRFMCIYKVWQHGFKTKHTLRVVYDVARKESCEKCNFCATVCFLDIDPKQIDTYDTCINCGECVTACNTLQAKKGLPGLLSFSFEAKSRSGVMNFLNGLSTRTRWTLPIMVLGLVMFTAGIISYQPYHLAVYQAEMQHAAEIRDYRVAVSNKRYQEGLVRISVMGLEDRDFTLSRSKAIFDTVGRVDLHLQIESNLKPGLYSFIVQAKSADGWQQNFKVQHFVAKGG